MLVSASGNHTWFWLDYSEIDNLLQKVGTIALILSQRCSTVAVCFADSVYEVKLDCIVAPFSSCPVVFVSRQLRV